MPTREELKLLQALPLKIKIAKTKARIREWYQFYGGDVYVSFSGGKDSTVLLDLVRQEFPNVEAVFVDTGLEYPEIRDFVKTFENVNVIKPKMQFQDVVKKYGYPLISKEVASGIYYIRKHIDDKTPYEHLIDYKKLTGEMQNKEGGKSTFNNEKYLPLLETSFKISNLCCHQMKSEPIIVYNKLSDKKAIIGTTTGESRRRENGWLKVGCNSFLKGKEISKPLSFWTEQDVLMYIKQNNLPICSVYGSIAEMDEDRNYFDGFGLSKLGCTGCDRTGCIFCAFGFHLEKGLTRFQRLKITHPKQYNYCINGGEFNSEGIWQPNKKGLGMGYVFDEVNKIYGDNFYRYK